MECYLIFGGGPCHPELVEGSRAEAFAHMLRQAQHDRPLVCLLCVFFGGGGHPELVEGAHAEAFAHMLRQAQHDRPLVCLLGVFLEEAVTLSLSKGRAQGRLPTCFDKFSMIALLTGIKILILIARVIVPNYRLLSLLFLYGSSPLPVFQKQ